MAALGRSTPDFLPVRVAGDEGGPGGLRCGRHHCAIPSSPGLDGFGGAELLLPQPPIAQVQVELGRPDGRMTGRQLQGLDAHARFPQRVRHVWRCS